MESDTTGDTTPTIASSNKKPKKMNLFSCWKNKNDTDNDNASDVPPKIEKAKSNKDLSEKETMTEATGGQSSKSTPESHAAKGDGKHNLSSKESKEKQQIRCPKCLKKKRDRMSAGGRMKRGFCNCRKSGYCNTNTIIFPNDYKRGSIEAKEIQYLQLIKDIIKDETRKNFTSVADFSREIDRQREEIKELKNLLLQNLFGNKGNDIHDNNDVYKSGHSSLPNSTFQSKQDTPRRGEPLKQPAHVARPEGNDHTQRNSLGTVNAMPLDSNVTPDTKPNTGQEKSFWNKIFTKN